jgi:hypothetical protein
MERRSTDNRMHEPMKVILSIRRAALPLWLLVAAGCATAPPAPTDTPEWQPLQLPGKRTTAYGRAECAGRSAWLAKSDASVSLWRRKVEADITPSTEVEFSWWVPQTIPSADLRRAETADSPVRVVFAFGGDVARLSMRNRLQFQLAESLMGEAPPYATLMYVWDNRADLETILPSTRSDRVRKVVVERGEDNLKRWMTYRRLLMTDFQRAFGEPPGPLIGIALLTDTDNTGTKAEACYGDVRLHR